MNNRSLFLFLVAAVSIPMIGVAATMADEAKASPGPEPTDHVLKDPCYPRFHLAAPRGWMNDPHPVFFKDKYHLFYQYSFLPNSPYGEPHSWGHATSEDLVHWKHMPVAITPKDHGIHKDRHIWSGCVVDDGGVGRAIYTIENIDVYLSTSTDDDLKTWTKHSGNPVVKGPPPGLDIKGGMRDPWVWKEADGWYMIIGSGRKSTKSLALPLYKSKDLVHWKYLHTLYEGALGKGDISFCECPSFFPLGNKYVLTVSHNATYLVGGYKNHRFTPEKRGRLDFARFYVPQFIQGPKGRRIMWAWGVTTRPRDEQIRVGWASMQTLPRVLSLAEDGTILFEPAKELQMLRHDHRHLETLQLSDGEKKLLGVTGGQLEIDVTFQPQNAKSFGLVLDLSPKDAVICYDVATGILSCNEYKAPVKLDPGEPLSLRIFFDRSIIEIFANKSVCLTGRIYPDAPHKAKTRIFAEGGKATVSRLDAWRLYSIWDKK